MHSKITLDTIGLDCAKNVKSKPTRDDSGCITYSNIINFSGKWLDNGGYLITQSFFKEQAITRLKNGEEKKSRLGKLVINMTSWQLKKNEYPFIRIKPKRSLETNPRQRQLEAIWFKASMMDIKKLV